MPGKIRRISSLFLMALALVAGCGARTSVHIRQDMDFSYIKRVAVLPFKNLSGVSNGDEIIRNFVINELLVSGYTDVEVPGDVTAAVTKLGVVDPHSPTENEIREIGKACKVQAVVFGTIEHWNDVKTGSGSSPAITLTIMMADANSGTIIWSVTRTEGGHGFIAGQLGLRSGTMTGVALKAVRNAVRTLAKY